MQHDGTLRRRATPSRRIQRALALRKECGAGDGNRTQMRGLLFPRPIMYLDELRASACDWRVNGLGRRSELADRRFCSPQATFSMSCTRVQLGRASWLPHRQSKGAPTHALVARFAGATSHNRIVNM
jgi:hypothetical protein